MGEDSRDSGGTRRSPFERFVEGAYGWVSRPPFFFYLCAGLVLCWLVSLPFWVDLKTWQAAIHTAGSVISLLLLTLLESASRRSEEAAQEKLNVLAALMASRATEDRGLEDAVTKPRQAVGLEERH